VNGIEILKDGDLIVEFVEPLLAETLYRHGNIASERVSGKLVDELQEVLRRVTDERYIWMIPDAKHEGTFRRSPYSPRELVVRATSFNLIAVHYLMQSGDLVGYRVERARLPVKLSGAGELLAAVVPSDSDGWEKTQAPTHIMITVPVIESENEVTYDRRVYTIPLPGESIDCHDDLIVRPSRHVDVKSIMIYPQSEELSSLIEIPSWVPRDSDAVFVISTPDVPPQIDTDVPVTCYEGERFHDLIVQERVYYPYFEQAISVKRPDVLPLGVACGFTGDASCGSVGTFGLELFKIREIYTLLKNLPYYPREMEKKVYPQRNHSPSVAGIVKAFLAQTSCHDKSEFYCRYGSLYYANPKEFSDVFIHGKFPTKTDDVEEESIIDADNLEQINALEPSHKRDRKVIRIVGRGQLLWFDLCRLYNSTLEAHPICEHCKKPITEKIHGNRRTHKECGTARASAKRKLKRQRAKS
jgi:hypothetical protein